MVIAKKIIPLFIFLLFFLLARGAAALTISPLVLESELDPGQSEQKIITLFNEENQDLYLSGTVSTFKPRGERGDVDILEPSVAYQALNFVRLPVDSLVLKPGEAARIPILISVPETAPVGGYYLAVMWETASGPQGGRSQVGLSSRLGVLLLLKVKGEAKEELKILNFELTAPSNFYSHLPVDFKIRVANDGHTHIKPAGYVVIKNIFNQTTALLPLNPQERNVLPQSIRRFDASWFKGNGRPESVSGFWPQLWAEWRQFALGRYRAQLDLTYGVGRQRLVSAPVVFWVWPWRTLIFLAGAIMIVAVLMVWRRIRRAKKLLNK